MHVVIVEDEALAAERLVRMLQAYDQSIQIIQQFDTVADTVQFLETKPKPDLLFLDIQLADGKSFSIFEKVKIDTPIIFITAYDQFAIQAFKLNSIDYLLKPIQEEDLAAALEKYKRLSPAARTLSDDDVQLFRNILKQSAHNYKERLIVKAGNKLQYKPVNAIAYFYAEGKTAYLVTSAENRKFLIDHTLESLEPTLNPKQFFRISRKVIVNINAVSEIRGLVSTGLEVKLTIPCEFDLSVSRDRAQSFKDWLNQ